MRRTRFNLSLRGSALVFLALLLLLITGCAPKPRLLPDDRTPQNVLRCALEQRIKFQTFASLVNLELKGEEGKFSGTVEFFYKDPDTFCLYPRTFFGIGMFKAWGEGDSLIVYFPGRNEYYRGSIGEPEDGSLWRWPVPLEVVLEMILGRDGLVNEGAGYIGKTEDLFLYESGDDEWSKEYWIDSQRCRLIRSRWNRKGDGESYRIEYKKFTSHDNVQMPKLINVRSEKKELARIRFLERKFDPRIPPEKFELQIPPDAKRVVFKHGKNN